MSRKLMLLQPSDPGVRQVSSYTDGAEVPSSQLATL